MEVPFTYIRNKIRKYKKDDLLRFCYYYIDHKKDEKFPVWVIFTLMKWSYTHGGYNPITKKLEEKEFLLIINLIFQFNNEHVSGFMRTNIHSGLHILYSQQFYLQKHVTTIVFAVQLKLYNTIRGKYNIEKLFREKTGLSIFDFIYLQQILWLVTIHSEKYFNYRGYITKDIIGFMSELTTEEKVSSFLRLLTLDSNNPTEKIVKFKRGINKQNLQPLETTFFILYPFQLWNNTIKVLHSSVLNYFFNYYIYDFMKSEDESFPKEFGNRFEKYIEFGVKELGYKFKNENEIKKILPNDSNVVDFFIEDSNIFLECKAIEIQSYTSINPTYELLYSSLKDSLLKAYFKQLLNVAKAISPKEDNWGIILTYKELFWGDFTELYEVGKDKFSNSEDSKYIKPENVFIIDIYTWDAVVQIVKDKKASLIDILKLAKANNSSPKTRKQFFSMHLDIYNMHGSNLSYLSGEIDQLNFQKLTN